jgi:putative tryptophan/tyrosine transport system substrate-binding protein
MTFQGKWVLGFRNCITRGPYRGHMQRRKFIKLVGCGAVTWPPVVHAQQPTKIKRIGLLRAAQQPEHELAAFLRALSEHGYVQGRNFVLVPQVGDGSAARLPELAAALLNQGVDIIVTEGTVAVRAAAAASSTIPIVTASAAPKDLPSSPIKLRVAVWTGYAS